MIKKKKKTVVITVIGLIIGMTMSVIFNKSANAVILMPIGGALGGLIGTIIDKRKKNEN